MELGAVLLLVAVILLVGMFISRPFTQKIVAPPRTTAESQALSTLLAERDRLISTLQELDFDHLLGKMTDAEYTPQRLFLVQRGAEVLRQIDTLQPQKAPAGPSVEERIESAVAARRKLKPLPVENDDLEKLITERRSARSQKTAGFCPGCGKPIQQADKFCPSCGTGLSEA